MSAGRIWLGAVVGLSLAATSSAATSEHSGSLPLAAVALIGGVVCVALLASLLAMCAGHGRKATHIPLGVSQETRLQADLAQRNESDQLNKGEQVNGDQRHGDQRHDEAQAAPHITDWPGGTGVTDDPMLNDISHASHVYPTPTTTGTPRQPPPMPSGPIMGPRDSSLDALVDFMNELVQQTEGRFHYGPFVIDSQQPVRKCLFSVHCQCKTTFGKAVDVLFFPTRYYWERHHSLISKRPLQDYRADMREVMEETIYTDELTGLNVKIPFMIITEATRPMDEVIQTMTTKERNSTISAIANQLAGQLVMLHGRKILQCSVTRSNVIQTTGTSPVWTFREYCSYVGVGKPVDVDSQVLAVRRMTPEVAEARRKGQYVVASPAMDVWQLGVLLFELYAGSSYWPSPLEMPDSAILESLSRYGGMPHERDPAMLHAIGRGVTTLQLQKAMITRMLERDPNKRPTAAHVKAFYEGLAAENPTISGNTIMPFQAPVLQIGS